MVNVKINVQMVMQLNILSIYIQHSSHSPVCCLQASILPAWLPWLWK